MTVTDPRTVLAEIRARAEAAKGTVRGDAPYDGVIRVAESQRDVPRLTGALEAVLALCDERSVMVWDANDDAWRAVHVEAVRAAVTAALAAEARR